LDISGVLIFLLLVLHLKAACSSDPELFFSTLETEPDPELEPIAMKHSTEALRCPVNTLSRQPKSKGEALLVGKRTMCPIYSKAARAAFGILVGKASQQQLWSMPVPKLQLCQKLPPARQPLEIVMPQHTGDSLHAQVISQGALIGPGFSSSFEERCHDLHLNNGQPLVPTASQMPAKAFPKKAAALPVALPKQWAQPVGTRPTTTAHSVNAMAKNKYARLKAPPRTPHSKAVGHIEQNSVLQVCRANHQADEFLELCRATTKAAHFKLMMQLEAASENLMGLEKRIKQCFHIGNARLMLAAIHVQRDNVFTLTWELRAANVRLFQLEFLEANGSAQGAT